MAFYLKSSNNLQSDRLSPRFHVKTLPSILAIFVRAFKGLMEKKLCHMVLRGALTSGKILPLREIAVEGKEILYGGDKLNTRSG